MSKLEETLENISGDYHPTMIVYSLVKALRKALEQRNDLHDVYWVTTEGVLSGKEKHDEEILQILEGEE